MRVIAAPKAPERSGPSAREKAKTPRTTPTMTVPTRRERRLRERWGCCTWVKSWPEKKSPRVISRGGGLVKD